MFAYNPTTQDRAGEIYGLNLKEATAYDADAIRTRAEADLMKAMRNHQGIVDGVGLVGDAAKAVAGFIAGGPAGAAMAMGGGGGGEGGGGGGGGAIGSIFSSFANKKAMQAKASSYGKIGDILGDTMFSENPGAMNALSQLKQTKDPYEAVMGYETLMGMIGPMSNMMMAQGRNQTTQQGQFIQQRIPDLRAQTDANKRRLQEGSVISGPALPSFE